MDVCQLRGVRTHNLKGIDLSITLVDGARVERGEPEKGQLIQAGDAKPPQAHPVRAMDQRPAAATSRPK